MSENEKARVDRFGSFDGDLQIFDSEEEADAAAAKEEAQIQKCLEGVDKSQLQTLYVRRRLVNGDELRDWAREQGFASTLAPGDLHVTVAFSREPIDWRLVAPDARQLVVEGGPRDVHQFPPRNTPNGALVLRFDNPRLQARWQEFRDAGASWDFPQYLPYVTLTYGVEEADVSGIEPYTGRLVFGPEEFSEVDDDWAGQRVEVPLSKVARRRLRKDV